MSNFAVVPKTTFPTLGVYAAIYVMEKKRSRKAKGFLTTSYRDGRENNGNVLNEKNPSTLHRCCHHYLVRKGAAVVASGSYSPPPSLNKVSEDEKERQFSSPPQYQAHIWPLSIHNAVPRRLGELVTLTGYVLPM